MDIKPNEICFLNYINGLNHSNNLPDYWKYNYGINPNIVVPKLIQLGLLEFKVNIKENISILTIPQLKEVLRDNNLTVKGKKSDLIARILGNIDISYLENKFPEKRFLMTEKGKKIVDKYYLLIINQKENYNFNNNDILEIYQKYPEEDNQNRLIKLFNNVIQKDILKRNYTDLELRINQFYNFYLKIDLFDEALFYYIIEYKLKLFNFRTIDSEVYLDDATYINFENIFIDKLKNIISLTNASDIDLKNIIDTEKITSDLPFKYFSNEECFKILLDLLNNKPFSISNYKISKPSKNSTNYIYYGYSDDELLNNTQKTKMYIKEKSNNIISNFLYKFFRK